MLMGSTRLWVLVFLAAGGAVASLRAGAMGKAVLVFKAWRLGLLPPLAAAVRVS